MSLLMSNIDSDTICFMSRWISDKVLQYLHVTTNPIMCGYTATMVAAWYYTLIPEDTS